MIKEMIGKLTDSYRKDKDSNIVKLISMIGGELETLKSAIVVLGDSRDIDKATGVTLDRIGSNVMEVRGQKDDHLYRQFIRTKIRANLSGGEIETLIEVLDLLFEGNLKSVEEAWNLKDNAIYDGEPASIVISFYSMPRGSIIPFEAIDRVVAGGVGSYYFNQEIKDRWLSFRTKVLDREAISPITSTFNVSTATNTEMIEGGTGPDGHIRKSELGLSTKHYLEGEVYNKYLDLSTKVLDRETVNPITSTFSTSTVTEILEGGIGPNGHIRKSKVGLCTKHCLEEEVYNKYLDLGVEVENLYSTFDIVGTFNLNEDILK